MEDISEQHIAVIEAMEEAALDLNGKCVRLGSENATLRAAIRETIRDLDGSGPAFLEIRERLRTALGDDNG